MDVIAELSEIKIESEGEANTITETITNIKEEFENDSYINEIAISETTVVDKELNTCIDSDKTELHKTLNMMDSTGQFLSRRHISKTNYIKLESDFVSKYRFINFFELLSSLC